MSPAAVIDRCRTLVTRRRLAAAVIAALALLTLAVIIAFAFARPAPAWWDAAATTPGPARAATAEALERGLTAAVYDHPPDGGARTIELKAADANAWLAERLARWMENRGVRAARDLAEVRASMRADGTIRLAARLAPGRAGWVRWVGADLTAHITPRGEPAIRLEGVTLGRLRIPAWAGAWRLVPISDEAARDPDSARWLDAARRGSITLDGAFAVGGGRRLRLAAIGVRDGALRVTLAADPPPTAP